MYSPSRCPNPIPILAALACLLLAIPSVTAREASCCQDFNNDSNHSYAACARAPNVDVEIAGPGQAGEDDLFLALRDRSGGSLVCGTAPCPGDWLRRVGGCGQLCFDVRVEDDGCIRGIEECDANGGWIPITPRIVITSGGLRAGFRATISATDADGPNAGWHRVCAPIAPLGPSGLPSSEEGSWRMAGGAADAQWDVLLSNVEGIELPIDFTDNPAEKVHYDNICFSKASCGGDCDSPCCLGACCVGGDCLETTKAYCASVDGVFHGQGSSCELGRCQLAQHCFPTSARSCEGQGGRFLPPGEACPQRIDL